MELLTQLKRMEWEKPYLEALIDALQPSGDVLQIGFGPGYAATRIQAHQPKHHTIIERDPYLFDQAVQWAQNYANTTVLFGSWEQMLPDLGQFHSIFFDDYSFGLDARMLHATSHSATELLQWVEKKIPQLNTIKYTDGDLDAFYRETGKNYPLETARFFSELRGKGQISSDQYERVMGDYSLEKVTIPQNAALLPISLPVQDNCCLFLEACLKSHMFSGSRFSCFSGHPTSKFDHPWFFEHIITNPDLDYQERWIPVEVPESCTYYPYNTALILTIENRKY